MPEDLAALKKHLRQHGWGDNQWEGFFAAAYVQRGRLLQLLCENGYEKLMARLQVGCRLGSAAPAPLAFETHMLRALTVELHNRPIVESYHQWLRMDDAAKAGRTFFLWFETGRNEWEDWTCPWNWLLLITVLEVERSLG